MEKQGERPIGSEEEVARQIGFAEHWLGRAKQEVAAGRAARSVLALLLAEAEVHHARERTLPAGEAALPRLSPTTTLLGATVLAALVLAVFSFAAPKAEMSAELMSAPPVIRFPQPVGSTLALVPAVMTPVAPAPPAPVRLAPVTRVRTERVLRSAPPTERSVQRTPPAARRQPVPAVAPGLVSDGDLIDLVLAAERSLRGEPR